MAGDLWTNAMKWATDNVMSLVIVFVIFAIIAFVVNWIFAQLTINILLSGIYTGIYTGGVAFSATYAILLAIGGAIGGFIYLWYVGALNVAVGAASSKNPDYMKWITTGLSKALATKTSLLAVVGLGFVGGFIAGSFILGFGAGFIASLFAVAYSGIALCAYINKPNLNFVQVFQNVQKGSSNAGIFLFITVLAALLSFASVYVFGLVFLLTPFAVVILAQSKQ